MRTIYLCDEDLKFCESHAKKRSGSMDDADTLNSQNFYNNKPPWWRHYIGMLGEFAYQVHSGYKVDTTTIGEGDDGTDFPGGIQVKASDLGVMPNLMFPLKQWQRKSANIYVLAWVVLPRTIHLLGWITREKADRVKVIHEYGRGSTYLIDREYLLPMSTMNRRSNATGILD